MNRAVTAAVTAAVTLFFDAINLLIIKDKL